MQAVSLKGLSGALLLLLLLLVLAQHYLRPMVFSPQAIAAYPTCFSSGSSNSRATLLGSAENCCIYTVGQLQPKVEVPAPQSKKLLDERKLQSKAWALRYINITASWLHCHGRSSACVSAFAPLPTFLNVCFCIFGRLVSAKILILFPSCPQQ